jgi:Ca-activated chloride channel family protein
MLLQVLNREDFMNAKRHVFFLVVAIFSLLISTQAQEQIQPPSSQRQVTLIYGLVVDNSSSLRTQIAEVVEVGKLIVGSNKPGDKTFLVRFVDHEKIKIAQDFTSDKTAFVEAFDSMFVEGGSSAIIDAVYFSTQHLIRNGAVNDQPSQRVLILITDGDERSSFYKQGKLFELVREKNVKVYVIGLVGHLKQQGALTQKRAIDFLNKLAEESGGRAFFPASKSEVKSIASGILEDVRQQK